MLATAVCAGLWVRPGKCCQEEERRRGPENPSDRLHDTTEQPRCEAALGVLISLCSCSVAPDRKFSMQNILSTLLGWVAEIMSMCVLLADWFGEV